MPEQPGLTCTTCSAANPPSARFCMSCGRALSAAPHSSTGSFRAASEPHAGLARPGREPFDQRRTTTILFADLAGFTAASERLDPELAKRLVDRCLGRLAEEVTHFGGTVDKYIGDNVMATFGAPIAHGDDPERAVMAGLAMQAAMGSLSRELAGELDCELALRVGVNTGEVLAGAVGDAYTVVGDAVNVASRLEAAAPPGTVIVGERTWIATREAIEYEALGALDVKGKSEPVPAWRAVALRRRAPGAGSERRVPLIDRDVELRAVDEALAGVVASDSPGVITLVGEAGIGKSRLLSELVGRLRERDAPVATRWCRCRPYGSSAVYAPFRELVREECGIGEEDAGELAWEKLATRVAHAPPASTGSPDSMLRRVAPLARLMGIERRSSDRVVQPQRPEEARDSVFAAAHAFVEAIGQGKPLLLVWDDIHWADEGTLELIEHLAHWLRGPVLQTCLAREELYERRPGWGADWPGSGKITIDVLPARHASDLVRMLLAEHSLASGVVDVVAERAAGNPLFAEEIVARLSSADAAGTVALPDTIQGLIAARLDSLPGPEYELVAHAAVIGRSFAESALAPVAGASGADLGRALAGLRERNIFVVEDAGGAAGGRRLAFRHVLMRDVAYTMLPKRVRVAKHRQIAEQLEVGAGEGAEDLVAQLAEHYREATRLGRELRLPEEQLAPLRAKAVTYLETAGRAAAALYSDHEALAHLLAAGELLDGREPDDLLEQQGDVAVRLGRVNLAIEKWRLALARAHERGAPSVRRGELHRKLGAGLAERGEPRAAIAQMQQGIALVKREPPSLALVRLFREAALLYLRVGDNMLASYASERALMVADQLGDEAATGGLLGILGLVLGRMGDTAAARRNLQRAIELARAAGEQQTVLAMLDLGTHLEGTEADYPAAAACYREALELAGKVGDVPSQVDLQAALGRLASYACDWAAVERATEASRRLARDEGLVSRLCAPYMLRGQLSWHDGELPDAIAGFELAAELAERAGRSEDAVEATFWQALTHLDGRDLEGADAALGHALAICTRAGLGSQAVRANALVAVVAAQAGRGELAQRAAAQAAERALKAHDPVAAALAQAAQGAVADAAGAHALLSRAAAKLDRIGRPVESARCRWLLAERLRDSDREQARALMGDVGSSFERLGIAHLADGARARLASL